MTTINGITHLSLSVRDLETSARYAAGETLEVVAARFSVDAKTLARELRRRTIAP